MDIDYSNIAGTDIDKLLTEIDELGTEYKQEDDILNWAPILQIWPLILQAIKKGDINYIKGLITANDIEIDGQNPADGRTLLMYAVIIGNIDFVKQLCNFGANVNIKCHNGLDAFDYATKYARYKITELIYYRQLQGTLGNDLKHIATQIHAKNKEAEVLLSFSNESLSNGIVKFMIKAIANKSSFSADLLFYAWYFTVKAGYDLSESNKLWTTMMATYTEILRDTSNKEGWQWLKQYFLTSLIWYLPHSVNSIKKSKEELLQDEDGDDIDGVLKQTLFYELLVRVREESKKQSNKLLKEKIDKIKVEQTDEWRQLVAYNISTKYSKDARQDVCGCLTPKYKEDDLSESKYPPSTHFSAKKHYDTNIYLNELIFRANIVDRQFQRDMKLITNKISDEIGERITYRAGPIKTLTRSQTKVENDYISCNYPTSAKILDINRCALQFQTIQSLMQFIQMFTSRIKNNSARSIKEIIRCKNGWSVYSTDYPQYTDIKLNVLVQSESDASIIAEIQLLLVLMSAFKKKAHKLYAVERKFELVYNFQKMAEAMTHFDDAIGTNGVVQCLTDKDDIHHFKLYWNTIEPTADTLTQQLFKNPWTIALFNIIQTDCKIREYLMHDFADLYYKTVLNFLQKYSTNYKYSTMFTFIAKKAIVGGDETVSGAKKDIHIIHFLESLFSCVDAKDPEYRQKIMALLLLEPGHIFDAITGSQDKDYNLWLSKSIQYILNQPSLKDEDKWRLCYDTNNNPIFRRFDCIYAQPIFQYFMNDKLKMELLLKHASESMNSFHEKYMKDILLHRICKSTHRECTKVLDIVLTSSHFTKDDMFRFFDTIDNTYDHKKAFYYACDGSSASMLSILNYFDRSQVVDWLCSSAYFKLKKLSKEQQWNRNYYSFYDATFGVIRELVKYFSDNERVLYIILSMKGSDSGILFDRIIKKNKVGLLRYILYQCPGLSYKTILKLATFGESSKDNHKSGLPFFEKDGTTSYHANVLLQTGFEIVSYFKKDRKVLLRLLSYASAAAEGRTLFMYLCAGNYQTSYITQKCMNMIVNESALTMKDMFNLLSATDHVNKAYLSGMHHALRFYGFAKLFVSYFAKHGQIGRRLLLKLLLQPLKEKRDDKEKICMFLASNQAAVKSIFTLFPEQILPQLVMERDQMNMGSNSFTFSLIQGHNFNKYVADLNDENCKLNDDSFNGKIFQTNPFAAACHLGKIETFNQTLAKYVKGDKKKLVELLLTTDKLPDTHNKTILMCAENDIRLKILHMIKDDPKSLKKVLASKDKYGKSVLKYFLHVQYLSVIGKPQDITSLKFIMYHTKLNDKYVSRSLYKLFPFACMHAAAFEILNYFKNDRCALKKLLFVNDPMIRNKDFGEDDDEELEAYYNNRKMSPLMQICKNNSDNKSVDFILNECALSDFDRLQLILDESSQGFTAVLYAIRGRQHAACVHNAFAILKYIQHNHPQKMLHLLKCMEYEEEYGTLLMKSLIKCTRDQQHNDTLTKYILECINDMPYKSQIDVLLQNALGLNIFDAIHDANAVLLIFSTLQNTRVLSQFLTAFEDCTGTSASQDCRPKDIEVKSAINILMEEAREYVTFDLMLDEYESATNKKDIDAKIDDMLFHNERCMKYAQYATNPFITSCYLGKCKTIMKLLQYLMKRNDNKLEVMLLDYSYEESTGHPVLVALYTHGYNEIISDILHFLSVNNLTKLKSEMLSMRNKFSGDTIWTHLVKENDIKMMKEMIQCIQTKEERVKLLSLANNTNRSCFDYATHKQLNQLIL